MNGESYEHFEIDDLTWARVREELFELMNRPAWVSSLLLVPTRIDLIGVNQITISAQLVRVTKSYLQFLKEQIRLGARGPEWNAVLQRRLSALRDHAGETIIFVTINHRGESIIIRLKPNSLVLVQIEYT
jgi:hypothetical protein